jgi:2-hydroxychromene-2-carboxylate isomerase
MYVTPAITAAPTLAPITFHFDFLSPFGFFARQRSDDLAARPGREVADESPAGAGRLVVQR